MWYDFVYRSKAYKPLLLVAPVNAALISILLRSSTSLRLWLWDVSSWSTAASIHSNSTQSHKPLSTSTLSRLQPQMSLLKRGGVHKIMHKDTIPCTSARPVSTHWSREQMRNGVCYLWHGHLWSQKPNGD